MAIGNGENGFVVEALTPLCDGEGDAARAGLEAGPMVAQEGLRFRRRLVEEQFIESDGFKGEKAESNRLLMLKDSTKNPLS